MMNKSTLIPSLLAIILVACTGGSQESKDNATQTEENMFTGAKGEVKLINLDPGQG